MFNIIFKSENIRRTAALQLAIIWLFHPLSVTLTILIILHGAAQSLSNKSDEQWTYIVSIPANVMGACRTPSG